MIWMASYGRSPLARGSPEDRDGQRAQVGSIPARAGEPRRSSRSFAKLRVDPRSRGGARPTGASSWLPTGRFPLARGSRGRPARQADDGGSIPLARGSLRAVSIGADRAGSIPARAGEPRWPNRAPRWRRVDPRSRGGASIPDCPLGRRKGRSPLARGSHRSTGNDSTVFGSIPARAGEPSRRRRSRGREGVDPRSRGGAAPSAHLSPSVSGRSPLARGSLRRRLRERGRERSIPARAGEPSPRTSARASSRVDPRSRGGASRPYRCASSHWARSPLARGSPSRIVVGMGITGSIPARAGEPRASASRGRGCGVDPRSRGGALAFSVALAVQTGRSPLARGSLDQHLARPLRLGSIPARAGEPAPCCVIHVPEGVDPRSRGGAGFYCTEARSASGRSPLARGSRAEIVGRQVARGSIPARAGEPRSPRSRATRQRVDPRSRGGAGILVIHIPARPGRSPLARGSRRHRHRGQRSVGSIPARAGEPA